MTEELLYPALIGGSVRCPDLGFHRPDRRNPRLCIRCGAELRRPSGPKRKAAEAAG